MKKGILLIISCLVVFSQLQAKKAAVQDVDLDLAEQRVNGIMDMNVGSKISGAVVCFIQDDSIAFLKAYGLKAVLPDDEIMETQTQFELGTMSYSIGLGSVLLKMIQEGTLNVESQVKDYWEYFTSAAKVLDLYENKGGFSGKFNFQSLEDAYNEDSQGKKKAEFVKDSLSRMKRIYVPGTKVIVSRINDIMLQTLVEKIANNTLDKVVDSEICSPLGMKATTYHPFHLANVAPTTRKNTSTFNSDKEKEYDELECWRGVPMDDITRVLLDGVSSFGGLFSTAEDLAKWAVWFLNLDQASRSYGFNCGLRLEDDGSRSYESNTGVYIRLRPHKNNGVIILTNKVHPDNLYDVTPIFRSIYNSFK